MVTNVLIADDHGVVRDGLRALLEKHSELRVVGAARNGQEAVREAKRLSPHVVIMDVAMPVMGGIEAARAILEAKPETGIIFLSMQDSPGIIQRALEAGARGYLTKECAGAELVKAIHAVQSGKRHFGKGIADKVFDTLSSRSDGKGLEQLSAKDREIVRLVSEGKSNNEVAGLMKLSPRTVETYRIRIMRKLEVADLPALVKFAIRNGLTTLD
jgi:DNA-binding NarL/FixJ family response regulator